MKCLPAWLALILVLGCTAPGTPSKPGTPSNEIEAVKQKYGGYTLDQARREGYVPDQFCLDAASFGQPARLGAMGFHATNESLLRGPIAVDRPQALMFDAEGRILGVEYEVTTDAVREPPRLFGRTFSKLAPHPGVQHEHYALHVWFVDNPNGQFADFNSRVACPPGTTPVPQQEHATPVPQQERSTPVPQQEPGHGNGH